MANTQANITSDGTITLLAKDATKSSAVIESILVSNGDASNDVVIAIYIENASGTQYVIIKNHTVPAGTTFYYNSPIEYNAELFDLKVTANETGGTTPSTSIFLTYKINNKI